MLSNKTLQMWHKIAQEDMRNTDGKCTERNSNMSTIEHFKNWTLSTNVVKKIIRNMQYNAVTENKKPTIKIDKICDKSSKFLNGQNIFESQTKTVLNQQNDVIFLIQF